MVYVSVVGAKPAVKPAASPKPGARAEAKPATPPVLKTKVAVADILAHIRCRMAA